MKSSHWSGCCRSTRVRTCAHNLRSRVVTSTTPSAVSAQYSQRSHDWTSAGPPSALMTVTATEAIIRAGPPTRVCILTTYNVDEYVFDALAAGASGFLLKTDAPERMVATVRAVAEGEFALGAEATATLVARYVSGARPSTGGPDPLAALTPRERDVFTLVARGLTNAEIADALIVGEGTVKTHVARILYKLGLRDRLQVVVFAHSRGLLG